MSQEDSRERRKHPRYPISLNVSLSFSVTQRSEGKDQRILGLGRNISGRTGDISFEGVLFKAQPLHAEVSSLFADTPTGSPRFSVDIEIDLEDKRIDVEAEIRWFKLWYTGCEPYQLEAGVFLKTMDSASRESWNAYFRELK
jgi:hypothetical protein